VKAKNFIKICFQTRRSLDGKPLTRTKVIALLNSNPKKQYPSGYWGTKSLLPFNPKDQSLKNGFPKTVKFHLLCPIAKQFDKLNHFG